MSSDKINTVQFATAFYSFVMDVLYFFSEGAMQQKFIHCDLFI